PSPRSADPITYRTLPDKALRTGTARHRCARPTVVHLPDGFRTVTLPGEQVFEPYRSFRLIDAVALARSFVFTSRGTRTAGTRHGFRHAARSPGRGARRRRGVRGDELPERPTDRPLPLRSPHHPLQLRLVGHGPGRVVGPAFDLLGRPVRPLGDHPVVLGEERAHEHVLRGPVLERAA